MGDHIWSGSADHSLVAWSIKTKTPVFELPQQGGFIRASVRVGWALWAGGSKTIHTPHARMKLSNNDSQQHIHVRAYTRLSFKPFSFYHRVKNTR